MYAVISDRGRQTHVRVGDVVDCDLNDAWSAGQTVTFDQVLIVTNEGETRVGTPTPSRVGEVIGHKKGKKLTVFRFKRRKNVRVKRGHRQAYTQVRITNIEG